MNCMFPTHLLLFWILPSGTSKAKNNLVFKASWAHPEWPPGLFCCRSTHSITSHIGDFFLSLDCFNYNTQGRGSIAISNSCVWAVHMVFKNQADFDFWLWGDKNENILVLKQSNKLIKEGDWIQRCVYLELLPEFCLKLLSLSPDFF